MDFITEYFIKPLGKYYTLPATIVYISILILLSLFLIKRLKIKEEHVIYFLPVFVLGGVDRALRDINFVYTGVLFVSPPIYFVFLIAVTLAIKLLKSYRRVFLLFSLVLLFHIPLVVASVSFTEGPCFILLFSFLFSTASFLTLSILENNAELKEFLFIFPHTLDGVSAYVSVVIYGFYEQHVFSRALLSTFPELYVVLKSFIPCLLILLLRRNYIKDSELRTLCRFVLLLGLALGTRNTLSLSFNAPNF